MTDHPPKPPHGDAPDPDRTLDESELSALLLRLLEVEPAERAAWLRKHVESEAQRARLLALFEEETSPRAPFREPLRVGDEPPEPSRVGQTVGRYRLVERVGQGGMGSVYRAERLGDFEHTVAIKLVRSGKLEPEAEARFARERQWLAALSHPNIARLFDGGTTEEGVPYLVMEYIDGVSLTRYCRENELGVDALVALFVRICAAVESAHRSLIVHGDLKPSNILVEADGTPKLLDFGVASLVVEEEGEAGVPAGLTPAYASPESLRKERLSTASDVYSLGVLLYELLARRLPVPMASTDPATPQRAISESRPSPPSREVADPERRVRISRELDAVVLKALEGDREQRYASVSELGADLERYLERRPVRAVGDHWTYRLSKAWQRHRIATTLGALALVALLVSWATALYQADQARRGQRESELQRERAETVGEFLFGLFESANVEDAEAVRADVQVVELLDRAVERLEGESELATETLVEMWLTLSDLEFSLGRMESARRAAERALDELDTEPSAAARDDALLRARVLRMIGLAAFRMSEYDMAEDRYRRALAVHAELPSDGRSSSEGASVGRTLRSELASVYVYTDRCAEAEVLLREVIDGSRGLDDPAVARDLGASWTELATCQYQAGDHETAYASHSRARELLVRGYGTDHYFAGVAESNLGQVAHAQGDAERAIEHFRRSLEIRRATGAADDVLAIAHVRLALVLAEIGEAVEARPLLARAMAAVETMEEGNATKNFLLSSAGRVHGALGEPERALAYARRALAGEAALLPPESAYVHRLRVRVGGYLLDLERYREAEEILAVAVRGLRAADPNHPSVEPAEELWAEALRGLDRDREAQRLLR